MNVTVLHVHRTHTESKYKRYLNSCGDDRGKDRREGAGVTVSYRR